MKRNIKKVAVIGSGIMGSGIACHFANIGVEVLLLDIIPRELTDTEIKKELTLIIKNKNENPKAVKRAVEIVIACGGIEYGYKRMKEFADKALQLIAEFPSNEAKTSLELLVSYTMNREK
jgi:3-hydroxyacyl-CoA dehydrogenase